MVMKTYLLKLFLFAFFCPYAYAKTSKLRVWSCEIPEEWDLGDLWAGNSYYAKLNKKKEIKLDQCGIKYVYLDPSEKVIEDDSVYVDLGTNLSVKFDFLPSFTTKNLKWEIISVTLFGDWRFKSLDTDACKYSHCPIIPEEVNHFEAPVYLPSTLSARKYTIMVKLTNGNITSENCCFMGFVRLRHPTTTQKPILSTPSKIPVAETYNSPHKEVVTEASGYFSFFKSKLSGWIGKKDESKSANTTVVSSQNCTSDATVGNETVIGNETTIGNETAAGNDTLVSSNETVDNDTTSTDVATSNYTFVTSNETVDNNTTTTDVVTGNETIAENEVAGSAGVTEGKTETNQETTIVEEISTSTADTVNAEANTTVANESPSTASTEKSAPVEVTSTTFNGTTVAKELTTKKETVATKETTIRKETPLKTESAIKKKTIPIKVTTNAKATTVHAKETTHKQETPSTKKQETVAASVTTKAATTKSPTTHENTSVQSSQAKTSPKSVTPKA